MNGRWNPAIETIYRLYIKAIEYSISGKQPVCALEIRTGLRIAGFNVFGRSRLTVHLLDLFRPRFRPQPNCPDVQGRRNLLSADEFPDEFQHFFMIQRLFHIGVRLRYAIFYFYLQHLEVMGKRFFPDACQHNNRNIFKFLICL